MTVTNYLRNKEVKMYAHAAIKNGKLISFVNGKEYTEQELNKHYPTDKKIIFAHEFQKGSNPDKTRIT